MIFKEQTKSIPITKMMVWEAYKKVKSNKGSAGVDQQTLDDFEKVRSKELYKIWNRLASGSYFPPEVKRVEIPKQGDKKRPLGIPTVSDRIAQQVVKTYLEPRLEDEFLENSYGYRPNKSALSAVKKVIVIHCRTYQESTLLLAAVKRRLTDCGLTAHPVKTKIVYCKKSGRNLKGFPVQFDFLGFSFRPIRMKLKKGGSFLQFDCIMTRKSKVRITGELRKLNFHNKTQRTIQDLAILLNPKIRGWINYYGRINRRSLKPVFYYLHHRMIKWILNKYKRFKRSKVRAIQWLRQITQAYPYLFYHWELGYQLT